VANAESAAGNRCRIKEMRCGSRPDHGGESPMTADRQAAPGTPHAGLLRRALAEPLLHFLLIGIAIFAIYQLTAQRVPVPRDDTIIISQADITRLNDRFAATWMRPPDADETRHLIDEYLREEVYYRQGQAMGLDRDDPVIRQRLRQKMEFLTDMTARVPAPTEAELQAHYQVLAEDLTEEPRMTFDQVFLGVVDPATAQQALGALQAGADPATVGQGTLLPGSMTDTDLSGVDNSFGQGFYQTIENLPVGQWTGPVESAFGMHLVRVDHVTPAHAPTLDQVRGIVEQDWRRLRALDLQEQQYQALLSRYRVTIEQTGP
jgi:hypothetical protein